jgi:uncharacterized delta-60 repeat protein
MLQGFVDEFPVSLRVRLALAVCVVSITVAGLCSPSGAAAPLGAPGELDPSFSSNGKVTIHFGPRADHCRGNAIAIQPDGKTVIAGTCKGGSPYQAKMAVARLTVEGRLDPSFGKKGKELISFGYFKLSYEETHGLGTYPGASAYGVALEPDGKIVIAGWAMMGRTRNDFAVARLMPNGELDRSFGKGGKATMDFAAPNFEDPESRYEDGQALAIQSDGKIVVVGSTSEGYGIGRFTADGKRDPGFGENGRTTIGWGRYGYNEFPYGVVVQPDGKILVSGEAGQKHGQDFAVARLQSDGSLDPTFSADGRRTVPLTFVPGRDNSNENWIGALALQSDGKVIVAGESSPFRGDTIVFGVVRLNSNGSDDQSFGRGGWQVVRFGSGLEGGASANAVTVQPDGDIVVVGEADEPEPHFVDFALARLLPNGTLDRSFSGDGRQVTAFGRGSPNGWGQWDDAEGVALTPDARKIVVGGLSGACSEQGCDFAVARYFD